MLSTENTKTPEICNHFSSGYDICRSLSYNYLFCETWRQYPGACFSMEIRSMWLKKYGPRLRLLTGSGLAFIKNHWHLQNIMFNRKMELDGVYWKPLKYEMNTYTNYLGNCNFNYEYSMKFHWTSTGGNYYQDHFNIQVLRQCILLFL